MTYKYSICYPNKKNIEYRNSALTGNVILDIAKKYPWIEQVELADSMHQNELCYSPSLDFTCIEDGRSFCLTAIYNTKKELEFSLWYYRPKKVNILFGLLGKKEKMVVDDFWSCDLDKAIKYLEHFVNKEYQIIEDLYKK
ncbi:hypothetical protein [Cytophaga aurantiaca]|uniref:hypothetical protein n=1 Tax=Cytophaga aurantiaca TaxID=29530 RepID=UPI00036BB6EC|nr:hypothetical protein [Cytophaga aurantiaca]